MDQTSRGYPYPECAPPLVKDASFIGQMEDLAQAIDADVTAVEADIAAELVAPSLVRVFMSAAVATTSNTADTEFDSFSFRNPASFFTPPGILIPATGWYLLGSFSLINTAAVLNVRSRFLRNGATITNDGDQSNTYISTFQAPYTSTTMLLDAGDLIQVRHTHATGGSPSWTYQTRAWALQLLVL